MRTDYLQTAAIAVGGATRAGRTGFSSRLFSNWFDVATFMMSGPTYPHDCARRAYYIIGSEV